MLKRIQALVRRRHVRFSGKAAEQIMEGAWSVEDLFRSILEGRIVKRECDETGVSKYKYVIVGPAVNGQPVYSCGKIIKRKGQEYFVITFHEVR